MRVGVEEWRPVSGWPYEVSNHGRVRRSKPAQSTYVGRPLKHSYNHGYPAVVLYAGGKYRGVKIHVLVAAAFLGPCPDGQQVNHKNGIKTDSRPENLEYVTPAQNLRHAQEIGLSFSLSEATKETARALSRAGLFNVKDIAESLGIAATSVVEIVQRPCSSSVWLRDYRIFRFLHRVYGPGQARGLNNRLGVPR